MAPIDCTEPWGKELNDVEIENERKAYFWTLLTHRINQYYHEKCRESGIGRVTILMVSDVIADLLHDDPMFAKIPVDTQTVSVAANSTLGRFMGCLGRAKNAYGGYTIDMPITLVERMIKLLEDDHLVYGIDDRSITEQFAPEGCDVEDIQIL